jgi:hypothetical protein
MTTIRLGPDGRGSFTFTFSSPREEISGCVNVGTEGLSDRGSTADKEQASSPKYAKINVLTGTAAFGVGKKSLAACFVENILCDGIEVSFGARAKPEVSDCAY